MLLGLVKRVSEGFAKNHFVDQWRGCWCCENVFEAKYKRDGATLDKQFQIGRFWYCEMPVH